MTNLTPNAHTEGHQLTIDLPPDIPPPQFHLFQPVQVQANRSLCRKSNYSGIITGMEYIDFRTALKEGNLSGWEYTVSRVYGASEEAALQAADAREVIFEEELSFLEAAQEEAA